MAERQIFDSSGIAVITGGGSGIGLEAASRCAAMGMAVAVADVQEDALAEAGETLRGLARDPSLVLSHKTDVSSDQSVLGLAEAVAARWPGRRISFLFNNAGVFNNLSVLHATPKDWSFVLGVNVVGVANVLRVFVPRIVEQGPQASGKPCHVVQTSSVAGLLPMSSGSYFSSKMAVTQISEGLHLELAQDPRAGHVAVHSLHPNAAQTNIWFSQRNRSAELEHKGTARTKRHEKAFGQAINSCLAQSGGLTASDVVAQLFAGIARGDFYIKAANASQGGPAAINEGLRGRMEAQLSGRPPPPPPPAVNPPPDGLRPKL